MSENELRRQCATIHEKDGFCKEPAQKSENELRKRCLAMSQQYIKQAGPIRKDARQKMNCAALAWTPSAGWHAHQKSRSVNSFMNNEKLRI